MGKAVKSLRDYAESYIQRKPIPEFQLASQGSPGREQIAALKAAGSFKLILLVDGVEVYPKAGMWFASGVLKDSEIQVGPSCAAHLANWTLILHSAGNIWSLEALQMCQVVERMIGTPGARLVFEVPEDQQGNYQVFLAGMLEMRGGRSGVKQLNGMDGAWINLQAWLADYERARDRYLARNPGILTRGGG